MHLIELGVQIDLQVGSDLAPMLHENAILTGIGFRPAF